MGKHRFIKTALAGITALYAMNKFIDKSARDKNMCNDDLGDYYPWKQGNIFYTKQGKGTPLLLIHNLDVTSSTYEWSKVIKKFEQNHTVYTLDLIGCGQSDKPSITYTNYLFVQLITDFIKEIIGEKVDVISSGDSSSIVSMANHMDASLFNHVVLINPMDIRQCSLEPSRLQIIEKNILYLPLVGTALYNYYMQEANIKMLFRKNYFFQQNEEINAFIDTYYQSAHIQNSSGRYLFGSKKSFYTNVSIEHAIIDKMNIHIIASTEMKNNMKTVDGYTNKNPEINVTYLSNCKLLPQLELPKKLVDMVNNIINNENKNE